MANWSDPRPGTAPFATQTATQGAAYDAGLRSYMLSVYNYMTSGVLLTGVVAMLFARTSWFLEMFHFNAFGQMTGMSGLGWIVAIAPLAIVLTMSFGQSRLSTGTLQLLFWSYAFLIGLSLSTIFVAYTIGSIAQAFFATAAAFAGLSLWGYTTGRNLSAMGSFLIMGLFGLIVAIALNGLVFRSGETDLVISVLGVLIFAGLTAYQTQNIKSIYGHVQGTEMEGKTAIIGALRLYLSFINMFMFLLRLMGSSRS